MVFILGDEYSNLPQTQFIHLDQNKPYAFSCDGKTRNPSWILEVLSSKWRSYTRPKSYQLVGDDSIPENFRTNAEDYKNSGYIAKSLPVLAERAMNLDCISPLSVSSPMKPELSEGLWAKLEDHVAELQKSLVNARILIITGPLSLPSKGADSREIVPYYVIAKDHIAVPSHFFKGIFYPKQTSVEHSNSVGNICDPEY